MGKAGFSFPDTRYDTVMRSRIGLLSFVLITGALVIPHLAHAAIPFFGPIIQDWGSANGSGQTCPLGWGAVINVINNIISFYSFLSSSTSHQHLNKMVSDNVKVLPADYNMESVLYR